MLVFYLHIHFYIAKPNVGPLPVAHRTEDKHKKWKMKKWKKKKKMKEKRNDECISDAPPSSAALIFITSRVQLRLLCTVLFEGTLLLCKCFNGRPSTIVSINEAIPPVMLCMFIFGFRPRRWCCRRIRITYDCICPSSTHVAVTAPLRFVIATFNINPWRVSLVSCNKSKLAWQEQRKVPL